MKVWKTVDGAGRAIESNAHSAVVAAATPGLPPSRSPLRRAKEGRSRSGSYGGVGKAGRPWAHQIAHELNVPLPLADILSGLGLADLDEVRRFLNPRLRDLTDPALLPNMDVAVRRIWQALDHQESIAVYGDYDVDGITSAGLLTKILSKLGAARVAPCLPNRMEEGYGLSPAALMRCMESAHPQLLITADCGTNAAEAARLAAKAGLDVVVTDHHDPASRDGEWRLERHKLPHVNAIVNPKLGTHDHLKVLAGVGVVFKLCHALVKFGKQNGKGTAENVDGAQSAIDLREYLDWVAMGTVADIVPLRGENRILVRHGLARFNQSESAGWTALIDVAGIHKPVDAYDIAFYLGPRLNAAGRLSDAEIALELLLTNDRPRAREIAVKLNAANQERQEIESSILQEAQSLIDTSFDPLSHFGLVVGKTGWHPGVIGIVASRLASRYRRPVAVVAFDEDGVGRGSCRSIEGYHLLKGLEQCRDHLITFGGHEMAAGLEIDQRNFEPFRTRFNEVAASELRQWDLRPIQPVHAWLELDQADETLLDGMEQLEPFGQDNPMPVLAVRGVRVLHPPRKVGSNHLRLTLESGKTRRSAIAFGMGNRAIPSGLVDVAFFLQRNSYQGIESLQLNIQDIRPSE